MGPVLLLAHGIVHSTLARVAGQKGRIQKVEEECCKEGGTTRCAVPSKAANLSNSLSISTLNNVYGLQTDANVEGQSTSLNCSEGNSVSTGMSAFLLSMMPAIIQTFLMNGLN